MREPTLDELKTFVRVRDYLRWDTPPEKELTEFDDLFKPGTVKFGPQDGLNTWNLYVAGYFLAARALLEGPPDGFFLLSAIYPAIFLYRHYLELEIKGIMIATSKLLKNSLPAFENDHDILSLWEKFKQMLPAGHAALREAPNIERLLKQINHADPQSMNTRYGLAKGLTSPSLSNTIEFDVDNFRDTMDKLHAQLTILSTIIETALEDE